MIPKEIKYNLYHYGDVRGDVHDTSTSCSIVKSMSKRLTLETENTLRIRKLESRF